MKPRVALQDTIARRFALTIMLAVAAALALNGLFGAIAGVWASPPIQRVGLLERGDDIVRMIEAAPVTSRPAIAAAATNGIFSADWYEQTSTVALMLDAAAGLAPNSILPGFRSGDHQRRLVHFDAREPPPMGIALRSQSDRHPDGYFLSVQLDDESWVVFTTQHRSWGLSDPARAGIELVFLFLSILVVTAIATYQLSRPIKAFTNALRRFGTDPRALPAPEIGPRELRATIRAFNAMQAEIQKFVEDRTAMLAAISHDLRTPLTKIRLRGEFIEDADQQARLFRDVDDMQAMVDSALLVLSRRSRGRGDDDIRLS